jgi:hypothetical protein
LIRTLTGQDEFYDMLADPLETQDLFPGLTPSSPGWSEYQALVAQLIAMGVG